MPLVLVNDGGCCHAKRYRFLKATIIGGLVVMVPMVALGAILVWATKTALEAIKPVFDHLPDKSFGGVSLALLTTVLTIVGSCFVAGLFAETALIRRLVDRAERLALAVPGYALMKNVGANLIGIEGKHPVRTVLVRGEATFQLGFLMETLVDRHRGVFIPGVPSVLVGTLHIVPADRVRILTMSVTAALDTLGRLGVGLRDSWPKNDAID